MIEITNKQASPLQLIVRSKKKVRAFTTLIIPGRGKGHNKLIIEDEQKTEYIDRLKEWELISTRVINK
jgi:hypothetical protein